MTDFLFSFGNWLVYTASVVGFLTICYYTLVASWWRKPEGRLIMSWALWAWACLTFISLRISTLLSRYGSELVRIVIYGVPIWLFIWLALRIAKAQSLPLQKGETNPSERLPVDLKTIEIRKRWNR